MATEKIPNVFECDLYQEESDKNLNPGLSKTVANYINRLQDVIRVNSRNPIPQFGKSSSKPVKAESIHVPDNYRTLGVFYICLTSLQLDIQFFNLHDSRKNAVITAYSLSHESGIKLIHYISYFVLVSLLEYHITTLKKHENVNNCPFDYDANPQAILEMIKRGNLCDICEESIKDFMNVGSLDDSFLQAARTILNTIAQVYHERDIKEREKKEQKDWLNEQIIKELEKSSKAEQEFDSKQTDSADNYSFDLLKCGVIYNVIYPRVSATSRKTAGPLLVFKMKQSNELDYTNYDVHLSATYNLQSPIDIRTLKLFYNYILGTPYLELIDDKTRSDVLNNDNIPVNLGMQFQIIQYMYQKGNLNNITFDTLRYCELLVVTQGLEHDIRYSIESLLQNGRITSNNLEMIRGGRVHGEDLFNIHVRLNKTNIKDSLDFIEGFLNKNQNLPKEFYSSYLEDQYVFKSDDGASKSGAHQQQTEQSTGIANILDTRYSAADIDLESFVTKDKDGNELLEIDLRLAKGEFGKNIGDRTIKRTIKLLKRVQDFISLNYVSIKVDLEFEGDENNPTALSVQSDQLKDNRLSIILARNDNFEPTYIINASQKFALINRDINIFSKSFIYRQGNYYSYIIACVLTRILFVYRFGEKNPILFSGESNSFIDDFEKLSTRTIPKRLPNVILGLDPIEKAFDKKLVDSIEKILVYLKDNFKRPNVDIDDEEDSEIIPEPPPIPQKTGHAVPSATSELEKPDDALNYKLYGNSLGNIIKHKDTKTPLSIGICAPWGRGKTVLMNYIQQKIEEKNDSKAVKCSCIEFNAWHHSKAEELWIAFYSSIYREIEKELPFFKRISLKWTVFWAARPQYFTLRIIGIIPFPISIAYIAIVFFQNKEILFQDIANDKIVSIILAIASLATILWNVFFSLSKSIMGKFKGKDIRRDPKIHDEVFRFFESVCNWLKKRRRPILLIRVIKNLFKSFAIELELERILRRVFSLLKLDFIFRWCSELFPAKSVPERIVVFVDDIDRCRPDKIMQMLEAINLFMDGDNFVFVLAMDARVVRKAVGKNYTFMTPDIDEQEMWGRSYLEKIIQIPFSIPQPSPDLLKNMKNKIFEGMIEEKKIPTKKTSTLKTDGTEPPESEKPESEDIDLEKTPDSKVLEPEKEKLPTFKDVLNEKDYNRYEEFSKEIEQYAQKLFVSVIKYANDFAELHKVFESQEGQTPSSNFLELFLISKIYTTAFTWLIRLHSILKINDWKELGNRALSLKQNDNTFKRNIEFVVGRMSKHVDFKDDLETMIKYLKLPDLSNDEDFQKIWDEVEMKISAEENDVLDSLLEGQLDLSPRLLVRLKNIYLIAKHFYQRDNNVDRPPDAFLKWIAISIKYPFEIKYLIELNKDLSWDNWDNAYGEAVKNKRAGQKKIDIKFENQLKSLCDFLKAQNVNPAEAAQYLKYTNLFNLILD